MGHQLLVVLLSLLLLYYYYYIIIIIIILLLLYYYYYCYIIILLLLLLYYYYYYYYYYKFSKFFERPGLKTEIWKRRHLMLLGTLTCIIGKSKSKESFFTSIAQKSQHVTNGKEEAEGALMSYPRLLLQCFILGHLWSKLLFYKLQGRKEVEKRIWGPHRIKDHGSSRPEDRAITKCPNPCPLKRSSRATVQCLYKTANIEPMKP